MQLIGVTERDMMSINLPVYMMMIRNTIMKFTEMTNNKQSILNRILNWFKLKCPDCKSPLYQEERGWFNKINIYHCTKCKKQWI
jgi:transposase-like protein